MLLKRLSQLLHNILMITKPCEENEDKFFTGKPTPPQMTMNHSILESLHEKHPPKSRYRPLFQNINYPSLVFQDKQVFLRLFVLLIFPL